MFTNEKMFLKILYVIIQIMFDLMSPQALRRHKTPVERKALAMRQRRTVKPCRDEAGIQHWIDLVIFEQIQISLKELRFMMAILHIKTDREKNESLSFSRPRLAKKRHG